MATMQTNMRKIVLSQVLFVLTICSMNGQVIIQSDSLSKYYYPYFNTARLKVKTSFASVANCYNFSTDGAKPVRIPNLYLALYHDDRQELGCLIDSMGHKLLDSIDFDLAFFNNRAIVKKKGFYGVVTSEGKLLKPFRFNTADKEMKGLSPFQELLAKEQNYDYYYQSILTTDFFRHKYGLIDVNGNLLVDTIYNEKSVLLSNPKEKKKVGQLYENILFRNDTSICIVNMKTGKIITRKWNKHNTILQVPLVYNHKQFYIFENKRKLKYGLMDEEANIILDSKYESVLTKDFAEAVFRNTEDIKDLDEVMWYPGLSDINLKSIRSSFEDRLKKNNHTEILQVPQYIFIKRGNKLGIFNMKTQKIEVHCTYEDICFDTQRGIYGILKSGKLEKEEVIKLK
jgi:hypothetical protein